MIDPKSKELSVNRQCKLLGISRSMLGYKPRPISQMNDRLMHIIDRYHLEQPTYGVLRMTAYLNGLGEYIVCEKRIRRLMRKMNLLPIYPKPNTSLANKEHRKYPYLLRGMKITRTNQVWSTDITYIPMRRGFMYLIAIMDLYSRKILSWSISNSMDSDWCVNVLKEAIEKFGIPELFNTDQGSQFTCNDWINVLIEKGIKISMDGKGRATDNAFIERFWRTVKQEHIYLYPANGGVELRKGVDQFIEFYNEKRMHSSLGYSTPNDVYLNQKENAA
jgi:putative transposase